MDNAYNTEKPIIQIKVVVTGNKHESIHAVNTRMFHSKGVMHFELWNATQEECSTTTVYVYLPRHFDFSNTDIHVVSGAAGVKFLDTPAKLKSFTFKSTTGFAFVNQVFAKSFNVSVDHGYVSLANIWANSVNIDTRSADVNIEKLRGSNARIVGDSSRVTLRRSNTVGQLVVQMDRGHVDAELDSKEYKGMFYLESPDTKVHGKKYTLVDTSSENVVAGFINQRSGSTFRAAARSVEFTVA
jgi:hypothetical protein